MHSAKRSSVISFFCCSLAVLTVFIAGCGTNVTVPIAEGGADIFELCDKGTFGIRAARARQNLLSKYPEVVNSVNSYGETPLLVAAANREWPAISDLLKAGANPNSCDKFGMSPLIHCAKNGDIKSAELLLQGGADPKLISDRGCPPIYYAALRGDIPMILLLKQNQTDYKYTIQEAHGPNRFSSNVLFTALSGQMGQSRVFVLKILLEQFPVDINSVESSEGSTPIYDAIGMGDFLSVQYLVENGASLTHTSGEGRLTPLQWADRLRDPKLSKSTFKEISRDQHEKLIESKLRNQIYEYLKALN